MKLSFSNKVQSRFLIQAQNLIGRTLHLGVVSKPARIIERVVGSFLFLIPLAFVLILLLGGCRTDHIEKAVTYKQYDPTVILHAHPTSLSFASGSTAITPHHRLHLTRALQKSDGEGPIYARIMMNYPETHKRHPVNQDRAHRLRKTIVHMGVAPHRIDVTYSRPHHYVSMSAHQKNRILVSIDHYKVLMPDCSKWESMGDKDTTQRERNFGCVTTSNLSVMIAEPRDFYNPIDKSAADAQYNLNIMKPYRDGAGINSGSNASQGGSSTTIQSASAFIE